MTNQRTHSTQRVLIPRTERVRRPGPSGFGWLDARLHKHGWLDLLGPEDITTYTFLCLVADRQGVSWYRHSRIREILGISEEQLWFALRRLKELDLIAYQPFHRNASEGFHQVLSLPPNGPATPG